MAPDTLTEQYPPLTPIRSSWMEELLHDHGLAADLIDTHGSPVHLHHMEPFTGNYRAYQAVFTKYEVQSGVYFARKANRCRAFVQQAVENGFGVDAASYNELKECLELGCDPGKLVLTAAVKDDDLIRLALQHGVLIIIDNREECGHIQRVAEQLDTTARVGVRLNGFTFKENKLYSRFGFDIAEADGLVAGTLGPGNTYSRLQFRGLHFHLDGYSIPQRRAALRQTLELADALNEKGITTHFIDMGGGIRTNYLADKGEWEHFWSEQRRAVRGQRLPLTFGNNGLGYQMVGGSLHGTPDVYPYYNDIHKAEYVAEILSHTDGNGTSLADRLREQNIEIRIEPGRSLLDQTGMTIAKVIHRKKDNHGNQLVGLQMNRSQLYSSSADFLLDPALLSENDRNKDQNPVAVYLTGAYCLEHDIILKRKVVLPQLPERGDVIAFFNTAGYMMHFYETQSHLLNHAPNLVTDADTFPCFIRDEQVM